MSSWRTAAIGVIAAAAIWTGARWWMSAGEPPPILGQVPEFHLISDTGTAFESSSLRGRPWLASFLFTTCPGPCPLLVERLKAVRARIPASELALVSFSVDPAIDTPAVLTDYKKARGIAADAAWTFVTGPEDTMLDLVQHGFLTGVEKSTSPEREGAVVHGVRVALIDGERRIRGFYSTESDDDLQRLERDVASLN